MVEVPAVVWQGGNDRAVKITPKCGPKGRISRDEETLMCTLVQLFMVKHASFHLTVTLLESLGVQLSNGMRHEAGDALMNFPELISHGANWQLLIDTP